MCNKEQIKKLRDYAELSWASYGYFHYFLEQQKKSYFMLLQDKDGNILKNQDDTPLTQTIEIKHILNGEYKKYNIAEYDHHIKKYITIGTLKGDMSPNQAKRFFERYKLVEHCPNTDSGFSGTLFEDLGEIDKSTGKRKEVSKDSKYILAIRGTEPSDTGDLKTDARMALGHIPQGQYNDMLRF
ncbi:hypothetical protein, partial [Helicobacter didelphidarum]|uniref:hypothetical protein n=1 Tax=Helicobacter didelphidarum TaxID=2040648 RepID=UPI0015F1352E